MGAFLHDRYESICIVMDAAVCQRAVKVMSCFERNLTLAKQNRVNEKNHVNINRYL